MPGTNYSNVAGELEKIRLEALKEIATVGVARGHLRDSAGASKVSKDALEARSKEYLEQAQRLLGVVEKCLVRIRKRTRTAAKKNLDACIAFYCLTKIKDYGVIATTSADVPVGLRQTQTSRFAGTQRTMQTQLKSFLTAHESLFKDTPGYFSGSRTMLSLPDTANPIVKSDTPLQQDLASVATIMRALGCPT